MRVLTLVPLVLTAALLGQQASAPSPEQLLATKLEQPFLKHVAWSTDWDVARERAAQSKRLIFGYFTTAGY